MIFSALSIAGAYRIDLERRGDSRGFFARFFCATEFGDHGLCTQWVQCNTSYSQAEGTLRGFHFQRPPMSETKLVRCIKGAVFDVIVDLRAGSPTFGTWEAVELNDDNRAMIYIPQGCAHGFQTLAPDTELMYFHSQVYSPAHEGGLRYDDPQLDVPWPRQITGVSARDAAHPWLTQLEPIQ